MPTGTDMNKMNTALYNASVSLFDASRYLSDVPEFADECLALMVMAQQMVSIIKPETRKVTPERMQSVLDEIIGFGETK